MPHTDEDLRTAAERFIERSRIDESGVGKPLDERTRQRQRSMESYLRGEILPRFIQRAADIHRATREHEHKLQRTWRHMRAQWGHDADLFARLWSECARTWDFEAVNRLIREHNEWYPVERDLPMNPRTGDYVLVNGKPYRRQELGPDWVLERFPAA